MTTGKKIVVALGVGCLIPGVNVLCLNLLIMFGFWYFAALGVKTKIRNYKIEREERREARQSSDTVVDGGIIYPQRRLLSDRR